MAASPRGPHAYIFAGPAGVGRETTALAFGRLLLCEQPVEQPNNGRFADLPDAFGLRQACGVCPSCASAAAGTNADLHLVYRQLARFHDDAKVRDRVMQQLGIDVVRQFLIDPAYRAPAGGRGKVFVVREAELLSIPSQNALLKTLEEPPPGVTIILTCTSAAELLATTRSRCQTLRFRPLPQAFVAGALVDAGVEDKQARFWAAMTAGSVGRALRLAEGELYEFKRELVSRLGALSGSQTAGLAELLVETTQREAKKQIRADPGLAATLANRQAGQMLLELLASVFRDALAVAAGCDRPLVHADQADAVGALAERFTPPVLAEILTQLARCEQLLWRNVNAKLLWDNVAITCATAATLTV